MVTKEQFLRWYRAVRRMTSSALELIELEKRFERAAARRTAGGRPAATTSRSPQAERTGEPQKARVDHE